MTSFYEDMYVIKLCDAELSTPAAIDGELQALVNRIKAEEPSPPPFTVRPDGVAIDAQYRTAAERLVDNPRINREGRGELYLEVEAPRAHIAF